VSGSRLVDDGSGEQREEILRQLARLYDLTVTLRRECPWDRKQTQEDIISYTLEEVYELADALASEHPDRDLEIQGELGDLLFQVYFMARVAEQEGRYHLGDVAGSIHDKLVRRHPHIFAESEAETAEDVRRTWDEVKRTTEGREGIFHAIPESFPATLFAQKLQQRAASVGFDWRAARDVLGKVEEESRELEELLDGSGSPREIHEEAGDLLFAVLNLVRKVGADPELALRDSACRFRSRVEEAARLAGEEGVVFADLELEQQENYYQKAKRALRGEQR